jgi:hypothetical protein
MTKKQLKQLIDTIGEALSADHGCIAIDDPNAGTTELSWQIDNSTALVALDKLAEHLGVEHGADAAL